MSVGGHLAGHEGPCLVVGVGTGPDHRGVLGDAADLASRLSAYLHVVHVVDADDYPVDPDSPSWDDEGARQVAQLHTSVEDALARAPAVAWSWHVAHGDPAGALHRLADRHAALLVVVGTGREGVNAGISRLLAGSVTHRLLRHSTVPVVVVPAHRHVAPG